MVGEEISIIGTQSTTGEKLSASAFKHGSTFTLADVRPRRSYITGQVIALKGSINGNYLFLIKTLWIKRMVFL